MELDQEEFQRLVNEELISVGLPEKELIDSQMAKTYQDLHYTVNMAVDDVFYCWQITRKRTNGRTFF